MRKMMCSVLALAALGGCGGDDEEGDKTAPTVSFSAPASVEGGERIAITVTATDNVDASVTPTFSCTGGTLTGNLLQTVEVQQNTTITCTATATDAAGNVGRATTSINVVPTTKTIVAASWSTTAVPGAIGQLAATNVPLEAASYDGQLNGKAVKLIRFNGDQLLYVLPVDMPVGAGQLTFAVGGRNFSIDVTVNEGTAISNPRTVLQDAFAAYRETAQDFIAAPSTSSSDRARMEEQLVRTNTAIANLGTLSDQQAQGLATFLSVNGLTAPSLRPLEYNPISGGENCLPAFKALGSNVLFMALGGAIATGSVTLAISISAAVPATVIPSIITAGIGIAGGTLMFGHHAYLLPDRWRSAFSVCWTNVSLDFLPDSLFTQSVRPQAAVVAKQGFRQGIPRALKVSRQFEPQAAYRAEITRLVKLAVDSAAAVSFLPADVRASIASFRVSGADLIPAANMSLGAISRSDIQGSLTRTAEGIILTFRQTNPTITENIDFTFTLLRAGEPSVQVPAQLVVELPGADDASFTTQQNQSLTSNVITRGGDTLEVVAQPANGSVTLNASGGFVYIPATNYFGTDQFTYRARNDVGVSRTATVMIDVNRKFDGVWVITTQSRTTSESQQGLCPNEQNSFTVTISRVSDTIYTSSYQGVPINFSMGSKDDPRGLHATATATYPDGPGDRGQTSEIITLDVPNSTSLSGTGAFEYTGPGQSCRGTTTITGRR